MTRQKHLKDLVRARMEKTGESYTAARRQIVDLVTPPQPSNRAPWHFAGSVPAATGLRTLLASAGVTSPTTKEPLSEAMVFGIAGGVGAGVFAFHYAKENFSSFFVAGRHLWHDDLAYAQRLFTRLGLKASVKESSGGRSALTQLQTALESGPALAWVDSAHLPHRAMPAQYSGGGYHVVVIYAIDVGRGVALMGDMADDAVEIPLDALAEARGRIKKQKHRLLSVAQPSHALDLAGAVRAGLLAGVEELASAKMQNFSLESFKTWGERLHGSKSKERWDVIFPVGRPLWTALTSIHNCIEYYGTGGGLCRPMFAEFLAQAATALGDTKLTALGAQYHDLGREWSALAEAALPSGVPAFREAKKLMARRSELLHRGGDHRESIGDVWASLSASAAAAGECFPLTAKDAEALRRELQTRLLALYEGEVAAQRAVEAYLQ